MLTDIVGTSVLTFAGVAKDLGWVPTVVSLVSMAPVSIYSAVLMSRTRKLLEEKLLSEPLTLGEGARLVFGTDRAALLVYFFVYCLYGFLGNASYLLVLGTSLQGAIYSYDICLPSAVFISCLCVSPIAISVRHLADSVYLCFFNLFLILAVVGIIMGKLYIDGPVQGAQTFLFAEDLTFFTLFGAMTNIVYSYTGHWLYFELMAEMRKPEEFPRVFFINAPLQIGLYLLVACWGYYFAGDQAKGQFLDNLSDGLAFQVASIILFVHVCIAFLVKNVVLAHYIHGLMSPRVEDEGLRARIEYAACSVFLLFLGFLVANAIPFFSNLLGLIGGLLSGPVSFLLPIALYIGALRLESQTGFSSPEQPLAVSDDTGKIRGLSKFDILCMCVISIFILMTMVVGTYTEIKDIVKNLSTYGAPFSCHLLSNRNG